MASLIWQSAYVNIARVRGKFRGWQMTILWIALSLLTIYFLYGLFAPHPNKRVFASNLPADRIDNGFLVPREVVDPDEESLFKEAAASVAAHTLALKKNAGRDDEMFHEPHWGHTSAMLRGTLKIDKTENLPEPFRVGLFAKESSYPAVARVGIAKDPDLGLTATRLAIKLDYPGPVPNAYAPSGEANELDLLFVASNAGSDGAEHTFFVRDGRQLAVGVSLKPPSLKTIKALANWRNIAMLLDIRRRVAKLMTPTRKAPGNQKGWAGESYYSFGPFALGDGAMKFCLLPAKPHRVAEHDRTKVDFAAFSKAIMDDWLASGDEAEFTLAVQLATPDCIPEPGPDDPPKAVMAAEYCDLPWDETVSPYIEVGSLTLSTDTSVNTPEVWGQMQFNAWNTLPSMRPLGQLFRMRKHVHAAHSNVRVSHLYGGKPGEMVGKCPFSG